MMKRKILCLLLALLMLLPVCEAFAAAAEPFTYAQNDRTNPDTVTAEGFWSISKYGNVKLNLSHAAVLEAFDYGDILTVRFADAAVDVPLCKNFSDVDSGCASLVLQMDGDTEETELNINMGNFAETYGIARKLVHEDKSYEWQYYDGITDKLEFTITLKEKAGYLAEFTLRSMSASNLREDYPALSDAEFANFRMVTAGEIGNGILYRSASPVDPKENRNRCSDAAAKAAGVTVFVDLADKEADLSAFPGEAESYFAGQKHIAVAATLDFTAAENQAKLAEALRFMAANPGVYDIFCLQGKDRTGLVIALLESLMGAGYDEIAADYMVSYYNYYGITAEDPAYTLTLDGNLRKNLQNLFGADPAEADLRRAAEGYLTSIGLTEEEIAALKRNLSGLPFGDVKPTDRSYADVAYLYDRGILVGVSDDRFAPEADATRAMVTTVLWRMDGERYPDYAMTFADVPADAWYTEAVRWAAAEKLVKGYSALAFGPKAPVTREQFAVILYRYAQYAGVEPTAGEADLSRFSDCAGISGYAAEAMEWAVGCGLLQGSSGALRPGDGLRRCELAAVLHRFCAGQEQTH